MTSTTFHKRQYLSYHHDGRRIYETLERNGPMTAQELGRKLGIESNVIRGEVMRLNNAGLIRGEKIGRGVNRWRVVE